MEDNKSEKFSVDISLNREEILDQVVCVLVRSLAEGKVERSSGYYDPDGDWVDTDIKVSPGGTFEQTLRNRVSTMLDKRLAEVLNESLKSQLRDMVKSRLEEIAEKGLPEFDRYGEMRFTPWSKAVAVALEGLTKKSSSYDDPKISTIAKDAFREKITKVLEEESTKIKATIRAAVDEQLSGTVIKTLRDAIGLR